MEAEIAFWPAHRIHEALKKRDLTVREVLEAVAHQIHQRESRINAYITTFLEEAFSQAADLDSHLSPDIPPLYGIPLAVKDNIATKGQQTTCASRILLGYRPPYHATVVERLLSQKALIIGKTNMDEFAMGASNEYSYFGPVSNPHNLDYVPGGSSGGSAAAVAAGEAVAALGSDTGGSVRQPAAYCGVVGLKPTYGRVSRYGLVAFASSLDQIGPITRDVTDAAILFHAIAGFDPKDATSVDQPVPPPQKLLESFDRERFTVGLPKEYFESEGLNEEVRDRVLNAVHALEQEGYSVRWISLPHSRYAIPVYYLTATSEASSNLARYDGVRYGHRAENYDDLDSMYRATRGEGFGPEVKRRIMLGTFALSAGYYEAYYLKASRVRRRIKEDFLRAFQEVDLIITPTSPVPPFRKGERLKDPLTLYLIDVFTVTANLAGIPAISIPCGKTREGLPVGLQILAPAFEEERLFKAARFLEHILKGGEEA